MAKRDITRGRTSRKHRTVYFPRPAPTPFQVRPTMPIPISTGASTILVRREAYERSALVRTAIDERLGLTEDEFRVERELVAIGPIHDENALGEFTADLERVGLVYFDDFFELSGNWPDWLQVHASS